MKKHDKMLITNKQTKTLVISDSQKLALPVPHPRIHLTLYKEYNYKTPQ